MKTLNAHYLRESMWMKLIYSFFEWAVGLSRQPTKPMPNGFHLTPIDCAWLQIWTNVPREVAASEMPSVARLSGDFPQRHLQSPQPSRVGHLWYEVSPRRQALLRRLLIQQNLSFPSKLTHTKNCELHLKHISGYLILLHGGGCSWWLFF